MRSKRSPRAGSENAETESFLIALVPLPRGFCRRLPARPAAGRILRPLSAHAKSPVLTRSVLSSPAHSLLKQPMGSAWHTGGWSRLRTLENRDA